MQKENLDFPREIQYERIAPPVTPQIIGGKKKMRRRKINLEATLDVYRKRLRDTDVVAIKRYVTCGDWLTTYDVWGVHVDVPGASLTSNAFVALQVCREKGVELGGVCTEHRKKGILIAEPNIERGSYNRVFVSKHNTFGNLPAHELFSIRTSDKVYLQDEVYEDYEFFT